MRLTLVLLTLLLPFSAAADTVLVTNTNDAGPGSLRAAIDAVNDGKCQSTCVLTFNIPGPVPESGYFTIRPKSLLPFITGREIYIDGNTQRNHTGDTNPFGPEVEIDGSEAGYGPGFKFVDVNSGGVSGLAIHSFEGNGVVFHRGHLLGVYTSHIGVDPTGTIARPNGMNGILIAGTHTPIVSLNVIAANRGNGIFVHNSNAHIQYNSVGFGRTAGYVMGNGANGIEVHGRVVYVFSNRIAFNRDHGIVVDGLVVNLSANEIWANRFLPIDLGNDGVDANDTLDEDNGPNARQNKPVITSARGTAAHPLGTIGNVIVSGTIHSKPHHGIEIEIFASPHRNDLGLPEARVFLGKTRTATDAEGNATWKFEVQQFIYETTAVLIPGGYVVATATAADGTSEMSDAFPLQSESFVVTTTADEGPGSLRATIDEVNAAPCLADAPCWISFRIPDHELHASGAARFEPRTPLPAITKSYVYLDGASQTYWTGELVADGPEVEIVGMHAGQGAIGLRVGTADVPMRAGMVRGITVRDFNGDGFVAHIASARVEATRRVTLQDVVATGNGGNGITIRGGERNTNFFEPAVHSLLRSTSRNNGGHGLALDAHNIVVRDSRFLANGRSGVHVTGDLNRIEKSAANDNNGAGFASAAGSVALLIEESTTSSNGALGIDRNDDGVTTEAANVTLAPTILSARWDPERNMTIVRGTSPRAQATVPMPPNFSGSTHYLYFWVSRTPDPSGYGEGEQPGDPFVVSQGPVDVDVWELGIRRDMRGQYLTSTRVLAACYWEFGCRGRDTSEYGNSVKVE